MSNSAYLEVVNASATRFTNAQDTDVCLYTDSNTQSIHLGTNQGSNSALRITSSNVQVSTDFVVSNNISAGNLGMFRNRIINGDMRIDQRNAGAGVGGQVGSFATYKYQPSSFYSVDRFAVASPNIGNLTAKQVTLPDADFIATGGNFKNAVALGLVPNDSMGIYLPMEGNLTDASGNNLSVTTTGTMQYVNACVIGSNALYLANDTNVTAGNQAAANYVRATSYTFPTSFSVSMWLMCTTVSGTIASVPFCTNSGSAALTNSLFISRTTTGTGINAGFYSGSATTAVALAANQWCHACFTYNNGSLTFYVNGTNAGTVTGTFAQSGFMLGNSGTTTPTQPFAGFIDDFRIYNRILTAGEIAALATNVGIPTPPASTSFTTRLTFDGTTADAQGGLSNVTVTGTAVYSPVCKTGTNSLDVTANSAAGGGASTATNALTYTSGTNYALPLTLAGWFNANGVTTIQMPFAIGNNTSANNFSVQMYVDTTSKIVFQAAVNSTTYTFTTPFTISAGTWYHVCTTINASSYMNTYVNGVLVGSVATVAGAFTVVSGTGSPNQLRIGAQTGTSIGYNFKGYIDDVRVYNRVLTSQEVAGLFSSSQYASYNLFQQTIEGTNLSDLGWGTSLAQPITASMWIKNNSSSAQQFSIAATNAGANLIAWIPFENNSYSDVMGFLNNSNLVGAGAITSSTFKIGSSAFDLTANTINAAQVTSLNYNVPYPLQVPLSISCWINPSAVTGGTQLVYWMGSSMYASTSSTGFQIELVINGSGQVYFDVAVNGANYLTATSAATAISAATWTHVTCAVVGGMMILYLNGVAVASAVIPANVAMTSHLTASSQMNQLRIGGRATGEALGYKGYVDDFRIYNTGLSATQVAQLYANNVASTTASTYLTPRSAVYVTPSIPANSWQRVQFTIPGDTAASNWLTNTDAGLTLSVCLGATSFYNTNNVTASTGNTVAVWNSVTDYMGSSAQLYNSSSTNLLASVANSIYITGVQLEKGSMATPFEFRPLPMEMQLCQRYFEKSYDYNIAVATQMPSTGAAGAGIRKYSLNGYDFYDGGIIWFKVQKRTATGGFRVYNTAGTENAIALWGSTSLSITIAPSYNIVTTMHIGFTVNNQMTANTFYTFHYTYDSEF